MSIKHSDVVDISQVEEYMPMGQILGYYGKTVSDFPTTGKALEAVRHLVKKNCAEHGRDPKDKPEAIDDAFPEFSKFFFVWCLGKKSSNIGETSKELSQAADLKNVDQLENAKLFMEGMGFTKKLEESQPAIANVKYEDILKAVEVMKTTYTFYHLQIHTCVVWSASVGGGSSTRGKFHMHVCVHLYLYIYVYIYTYIYMTHA